MRAVLDPNVLVSALLSGTGAPAQLVRRWLDGAFDLIVSGAVLAELERALAYPKIRAHVVSDDAAEFVALLRHAATIAIDPLHPARRSADPGDDYLIALAEHERAVLVSGDRHLLALANTFPIMSARAFLDSLDD